MSYFCANAISINKEDNTCKVKGGDNNVVPRSNDWTHFFPVRELIYELNGGMIQFKTRNDKNVHIESLAREAAKKIEEMTGVDAYTLGGILNGKQPLDELEKSYLVSIGEYQSGESHMSEDYCTGQIELAQQLLDIIHDNVLISKIMAIVNQFVEDVKKPLPKTKFVVAINQMFIRQKAKRHAYMTIAKADAQQFTKARAEDVASNYSNAKVIPA